MTHDDAVTAIMAKLGFDVWPAQDGKEMFMLEMSADKYAIVLDPFGERPKMLGAPATLVLYEWVGSTCYERWAGSYRMMKELIVALRSERPWDKHPQCEMDQCRSRPSPGSTLCRRCITKMN